jgi:bifunctional DNase/RNase
MDKKTKLRVVNIIDTQAQLSAFVMLLQEIDGGRRLPVIIGPAEAETIANALNNVRYVRPLTHDLFVNTLKIFGIDVVEVMIYKAVDGIFYSYIYYKKEEEIVRIDSRTSDAIALAVRTSAPIYINSSILERECIPMDAILEGKEANVDHDNLNDKDIRTLRKDLDRAIKEENYELASILRDEIVRRQ